MFLAGLPKILLDIGHGDKRMRKKKFVSEKSKDDPETYQHAVIYEKCSTLLQDCVYFAIGR